MTFVKNGAHFSAFVDYRSSIAPFSTNFTFSLFKDRTRPRVYHTPSVPYALRVLTTDSGAMPRRYQPTKAVQSLMYDGLELLLRRSISMWHFRWRET